MTLDNDEKTLKELINIDPNITLKELSQYYDLSYYKIKKLIKTENIRKNFVKSFITKHKHLTVHNIYKKLQQEGITISKRHVRRIKNAR